MKQYKVIVNGTVYEVELMELAGADSAKAAPTPMPAAPAPASASTPAPAPASAGTADEPLTSPMPGTILAVNVAPGDSVKKGQVLMTLEAMKMENEILCPRDAVVGDVKVAAGAAVETDALLLTLR